MSDYARLIETLAAKGPVCLCAPGRGCRRGDGASWCGPQKSARRALAVLRERGWHEPPGLQTAMAHALTGEGRDEFDRIMQTGG